MHDRKTGIPVGLLYAYPVPGTCTASSAIIAIISTFRKKRLVDLMHDDNNVSAHLSSPLS